MPDSSSGNYSLPAGYVAVTGQTIQASQHNPPLEDIAAALTRRYSRDGRAPMLGDVPMNGFRVTNMGAGTADSDAVTLAQLRLAGVPTGTILDFAGGTAPTGYLFCFGHEVSRTTYAALFAVIGTTYGAGDGSTTFNVPDLRGRVAAGRDTTDAGRLSTFWGTTAQIIGTALGAASHVLTTGQMPSHNHGGQTTANGAHAHNESGFGNSPTGPSIQGTGAAGPIQATVSTSTAPDHVHGIPAQGGGEAHSNTQPTLIVNKIIRA